MRLRVARFISLVLNPLALIIFVPFFLLYKSTGDLYAAVNWTLYTLVFLLIIAIFILICVRKGIFTDYDVSKREQRPLLFFVAIILALLYLFGLYLFNAPTILFIVTYGIIIGIIAASIVNRWIKASMHVATISAMLSALAIVYGRFYYLLLLLIPIVAYIRVKAKRHTISETIAGAIFGCALSLLLSLMVRSVLG
jgi:membrane-associated phospholipid phosphatase